MTLEIDDKTTITLLLDEVWRLRRLCALHALGIEADLAYKTFPKSRRSFAEERVRKMRLAAQGKAREAIAGTTNVVMRAALGAAGASEILTRSMWEDQQNPDTRRNSMSDTAPTETPAEPPEPMMQFFGFAHLPDHLQQVSRNFYGLAEHMVRTLPRNPERTAALRKLLESKDCALRALIYKDPQ